RQQNPSPWRRREACHTRRRTPSVPPQSRARSASPVVRLVRAQAAVDLRRFSAGCPWSVPCIHTITLPAHGVRNEEGPPLAAPSVARFAVSNRRLLPFDAVHPREPRPRGIIP